MKIRLLTIISLAMLSTMLFAEGTTKRTLIIKDGKVITDNIEGDAILQLADGSLFSGKRAHLGVRLTELSSELREHYGAPKDSGVLVASVEDDSPADKAGIKVGDIVVAVDGKDIESSSELRRALRDKKEGDTVRIEVLRGRARQTLVATVVEREGMRLFAPGEIRGLEEIKGLEHLEGLSMFNGPEWKARIETFGDCASLQTRIKELESRLKDLEKKLQK